MTATKVKAYLLLVELSEQLKGASYERHLVAENYAVNSLSRTKTGKMTATLKDLEFIQLRMDRLTRLSRPAQLFVINNILENLKKYNLLWYHPVSKKSQEKTVLKELVNIGLLFRTESLGIYIVNPAWVWRGTMFTCVESTKALLRAEGKPSLGMIRDLKPKEEYILTTDVDHFHLLDDKAQFTTNLLEEPGTPYLTK